jgi:hypothetical protein
MAFSALGQHPMLVVTSKAAFGNVPLAAFLEECYLLDRPHSLLKSAVPE